MLLGSFLVYWQILTGNSIFTCEDSFYSQKSCQNTSFGPPYEKWGSIVAMLLGSFQVYWQILTENAIYTCEDSFYSQKSCQNTSFGPAYKK